MIASFTTWPHANFARTVPPTTPAAEPSGKAVTIPATLFARSFVALVRRPVVETVLTSVPISNVSDVLMASESSIGVPSSTGIRSTVASAMTQDSFCAASSDAL